MERIRIVLEPRLPELQVGLGTPTDRVAITLAQIFKGQDAVTYEFPFPTPAASWAITHNLGRHPSVTCVDASGEEIGGAVTYVDGNVLHVDFAVALAGTAYLN